MPAVRHPTLRPRRLTPPPPPSAGAGSALREVDRILRSLTSCVSRDLCDELAVNFCYANSRAARRRLVRALLDVPRGQLQLLPYYARVAASLAQLYPEVRTGGARARRWGPAAEGCARVCVCVCVGGAVQGAVAGRSCRVMSCRVMWRPRWHGMRGAGCCRCGGGGGGGV
jgi:hypothetical protein